MIKLYVLDGLMFDVTLLGCHALIILWRLFAG